MSAAPGTVGPVIATLAVENYRSLRHLVVPLAPLNVVTGANGSGKSSLYRALRLLADAARNGAVAALARQAEKHYGCPQDVEWAVEDGPSGAGAPAAVLLQSRPETVWSRKPPRRAAAAGGGYMASIVSTLVAPLHAGRGAGDDH